MKSTEMRKEYRIKPIFSIARGNGKHPLSSDVLQDVTVEPEKATPAPRIVTTAENATFTATITLPRTFVDEHRKWVRWVRKIKQMIHLAKHGKNKRIRKKNLKRAYALYRNGHKSIKL